MIKILETKKSEIRKARNFMSEYPNGSLTVEYFYDDDKENVAIVILKDNQLYIKKLQAWRDYTPDYASDEEFMENGKKERLKDVVSRIARGYSVSNVNYESNIEYL